MDRIREKRRQLKRRHLRVRRGVSGTAERPRLSVYRSLTNIYCQIINDREGRTLLALSTLSPELKAAIKSGGNMEGAKILGKALGEKAVAAGIKKVVFDRGGYKYHGRVKALSEAAREAGLEF
ncbi:MAG: 50S ribosomal protein L18 [Planctomycetota bacterium]